MKIEWRNQRVLFGILLILLSVFVYILHFLFFRDVHHILIYLVGDIAFVFIEVLMVTLILHHVLTEREKRKLLNKLNMVIGAFFSEVGEELLKFFSCFDIEAEEITKHLIVDKQWSAKHFAQIKYLVSKRGYKIEVNPEDLIQLKIFLVSRRDFLVRLLENPNLLEHDSFTELLWAVFHLEEELMHRKELKDLPETDYKHLAGDIKRVYPLLAREWLSYMQHLKDNYPYLFSLAIRTNPFDPEAMPEVR